MQYGYIIYADLIKQVDTSVDEFVLLVLPEFNPEAKFRVDNSGTTDEVFAFYTKTD